MKENIITDKQKRVLKIIGEYYEKNGESPTVSEIKKILRVKSLRSITQYLDILEKKGFIYRKKNVSRGVIPVGYKSQFNPEIVSVSVIGSAGCDNQSIFADTIFDEHINISKNLIEGKEERMIAIRAMGESMTEAGINDGDIVLVEKTEDIQNNDRAVVIINDIAVIKRIFFTDDTVILKPDSKEEGYKPIIMDKDFRVMGKVIRVVKMPKDDFEIVYFNEDR
jgi:SOS regulatory protein LexA